MNLDKQQQAIVESNASKICVIAGAGSGKTGTTVERVRKLLKDGHNPAGFVCITFTKMAAQEMRSRLSDIPGHDKMFIGTIHAFAYRILAKAGIKAELLTPERERDITRTLIQKYAKHLTLEKYDEWADKHRLMELGYYKKYEVESILTADEAEELLCLFDHIDLKYVYESMSKEDVEKLTERILERENAIHSRTNYPETMRSVAQRLGMITFNGLLEKCNEVAYKHRIQFLFVDEFQDVGAFEFKFLMGLNAQNVFVVGDDYQCQPGDTQITYVDGKKQPLSESKPGDVILSWNIEKQRFEPGIIECVKQRKSSELLKVTLEDDSVSYYTPTHRCVVFYALSASLQHEYQVVCANQLHAGDLLIKHLGYHVSNIVAIKSIETISEPTLVYSLQVYSQETYVADDIVTHNSIYAFKGADFEYFKKLSQDKEFTTFRLENNYRCEKHIVDFGDKIISQINDVIPKKCVSKVTPLIKGTLIYKQGGIRNVEQYLDLIDYRDYGKWFILTRSNNDMIDISRLCYRKNIPTVTFKKGNMTAQELDASLAENAIKILTVHSAKGLESENVLLYGNFPVDKSEEYWNQRGTEECRIFYVGATRAKKNLIVISNHRDENE